MSEYLFPLPCLGMYLCVYSGGLCACVCAVLLCDIRIICINTSSW